MSASWLNQVYEITGKFGNSLDFKSLVFIIGTGRSGTTLLLKVLGSCDQIVTYPNEMNELWHPLSYPFKDAKIKTPPLVEDAAEFSRLSVANWPAGHRQRIINRLKGYYIYHGLGKVFIVKSAMISFLIPEILSLFPQAKFIHIYRNGVSVVESFLEKEWHKYNQYFKAQDEYRLNCAKYWNECILEIAAQNQALQLEEKGKLLEFSYESFCDSPREVLGKLCDYIGVDLEQIKYDLGKIKSTNYKVGSYLDPQWEDLNEIMGQGMRLKQYLV